MDNNIENNVEIKVERPKNQNRMVAIAVSIVVFIVLIICVSLLIDKKPNEEDKIVECVENFVEAYNAGDMEQVLECLDAKTRNKYNAMLNLLGGLAGSIVGMGIDMKDLFSLGVALSDGDYLEVDIKDVELIDSANALVEASIGMYRDSEEDNGYFVMVLENDKWCISDIVDEKPGSEESGSGESDSGETGSSGSSGSTDGQTPTNKTKIDAFSGLKVNFMGISPYCTAYVNNSACSEDAQLFVNYSFDKEKYKNGDSIVVTASLTNSTNAENCELLQTQKEYKVENQAEYITSLDGVDTSSLKSELADYIVVSENSAKPAGDLIYPETFFMGAWYGSWNESHRHEFDLIPKDEIYFSCLKAHKRDDESKAFNTVSFIYNTSFKGANTNNYVCVMAQNLVKNADGSITWGSVKNAGSLDFTYTSVSGDLQNAVNTLILVNSIDYNISKIEELP